MSNVMYAAFARRIVRAKVHAMKHRSPQCLRVRLWCTVIACATQVKRKAFVERFILIKLSGVCPTVLILEL